MNLQKTMVKYGIFCLVCIACCVGMFMSKPYWMPIKYTQEAILTDPVIVKGISEHLIDLETKIQVGDLPLVDGVAHRFETPAYIATVVKMKEEKKQIPYVKYRVEMSFLFPYMVIPRHKKLDAILVDLSPEQNYEFADLFWNIK